MRYIHHDKSHKTDAVEEIGIGGEGEPEDAQKRLARKKEEKAARKGVARERVWRR